MKKFYSKETVQTCNDVSILALCSRYGIPLEKRGENYYIPESDGFTINESKNTFYHFKETQGGYGAVSFLMQYKGIEWYDALQMVAEDMPAALDAPGKPVVPAEEKKFVLPEKNKNFRRVFAYLCKTRGLDKDIVAECMHRHMVYEDKRHNCVFVGFDGEKPSYAALRSSAQEVQFRGEVSGSRKQHGFCYQGSDGATPVNVFESPIDCLSGMTLAKQHGTNIDTQHWLSLGGCSDKALEQFLQEHPTVKAIRLYLDNDEAGERAKEKITAKYALKGYAVSVPAYKGKDVNELLTSKRMQGEMQRIAKAQIAAAAASAESPALGAER